MFTPFFEGVIIDAIEDAVSDILNDDVPKILNDFISAQGGDFQVPGFETWYLDWQTKTAATVTATALEVGIQGIMWNSVNGEAEWSTDFVEMPYKSTSDAAQFQVFLSDESVDSLMGSFL